MQTILIRKSEMHLIRLINLLICSYYLLVNIELNMSNNCKKFMRAFVIKFNSRSLNELPPPKLYTLLAHSNSLNKFRFSQAQVHMCTNSTKKRSMFFFLHNIYLVKNLRKRSLLFLYFFFHKTLMPKISPPSSPKFNE